MPSSHCSVAVAAVVVTAVLAGCGGTSAADRGALDAIRGAAPELRDTAVDAYGAHGRICRRVTLEKYRRTALQRAADGSAGC
jgi:hypothetical protein